MTITNVTSVQYVGDGKDPQRIRAHADEVSNILNSLLLNGSIVRTGPSSFVIGSGGLTPGTFTDATIVVGPDGTITSVTSGGGGGGGINAYEHPFTLPLLAGVTQVNTTGFTSSDDTNGLFVTNASVGTGNNLVLTHIAVPVSGAWNLDVRVQSMWWDDTVPSGGAHLYESGTGKIITLGVDGSNNGAVGNMQINYWNSVTSYNSTPLGIAARERPPWLRISYDGTTNYTFWRSGDGYSWVQFGTGLSHTGLFTTGATHAGFYLNPSNSAVLSGIKCMSLTCA